VLREAWLFDLVCSQYPGCLVVAPGHHLVLPFCDVPPIADGYVMQHSGVLGVAILSMRSRCAWLTAVHCDDALLDCSDL
jgi:hypothetical protein